MPFHLGISTLQPFQRENGRQSHHATISLWLLVHHISVPGQVYYVSRNVHAVPVPLNIARVDYGYIVPYLTLGTLGCN